MVVAIGVIIACPAVFAQSTTQPTSQTVAAPACHAAPELSGFHSLVSSADRAADNQADVVAARGRDAFARGDFGDAANQYRASVDSYLAAGDWDGYCRSVRDLAAAYEALGNYRLAMDILCPAREAARLRDARQFMLLSAAMGRALGHTRSHHDPLGDPEPYFLDSLASARSLGDKTVQMTILNDLANLYAARGQIDDAIADYDKSAALADERADAPFAAQVRCNKALAMVANNVKGADAAIATASTAVAAISEPNQQSRLLVTLGICADRLPAVRAMDAEQRYRRAIDIATAHGDDRTACFAWLYLGHHFEILKKEADALAATRHSRFIAQSLGRGDILYRCEAQLGRILRLQGDLDGAIEADRRAVACLEGGSLRDDLAVAYAAPLAQGTFRNEVGRVYYDLADMLLRKCDAETDPAKVQQNLRAARTAIEQFKVAELKNYFQDECLRLAETSQKDIDAALASDRQTAVVYVIPLDDRTEILVSLPGIGPHDAPTLWRPTPTSHGREELFATATDLRGELTDAGLYDYLEPAGKLYDWLIRPIDSRLKRQGITTLVFVPDGALRSVPPGALYDTGRQRYLVQDYAVAITPGMMLAPPEPISGRRDIQILAGGLSQAKTLSVAGSTISFAALPNVPVELRDVSAAYRNRATVFTNGQFLESNVSQALQDEPYAVVHLATHANFDADVRKTFVVTGDAEPIDMAQLQQLIEPSQFRGHPVELLSLSACETAAGDDGRSALGLAGVSVRAGARSALATLWLADDQATASLIGDFYRQLSGSTSVSKAQALRLAQVRLLNDPLWSHPRFWAPFVIVGNWR